jgi:predicted O-linked N-acetylglucosamine transferase (SPINDLY family)/predicted SAM-dependent methyltransferase
LHAAVEIVPDHLMTWLELLFIALQACDFELTATARRRIDEIAATKGFSGASIEALCNLHYLAVLEGTSPEAATEAAAEIVRCLGEAPRLTRTGTGARLKIGYLSANFGNQAIGHVSRRLYASHDRTRFEIHAYALADRSREEAPFHHDIRRGVDIFRDAHDRDPEGVAALIREDGIDILVNLDGHMSAPGIRVMALRPAPIQVSWLGVAGSPGLPYHDYVVADRVVVPDGEQGRYPEAVVRLPVYHCADRHEIAGEPPSRSAEGLPDDALVLCAFNNTQKIEQRIFACWMEILAAVPHAVLWLSKGDSPVLVERLRKAAERREVDGKRLIFARIEADKARHLRRHDLADLFLDTLSLTASTTALDALSTGLPMITCPGTTWPSRIAASFLTSLGLPDFIAGDLTRYRQMALDLCGDPAARAAARRRFETARSAMPLFDIRSFTAHLEAAYLAMGARHMAGALPEGFDIEPLGAKLKLHIGSGERKPGWTNVQPGWTNVQPGWKNVDVDFVGSGTDLGAFADGSIDEIYAAPIPQRPGFRDALPAAFAEACRALKPGGVLRLSVPDLETLGALIVNPLVPAGEKSALSQRMVGAPHDAADRHEIGLNFESLDGCLKRAGFATVRRVEEFGLFDDASASRRFGVLINLNVEAVK